jgi:C4-dicarboxylate-specific signal transduction histidine kinase
LNAKSFLIALAALLLLAAIISMGYLDNRGRATAEAGRVLAARAEHVADQVDRVLEWRTIESLTFVALPSLRGFAASDETARPSRTVIALAELQAIVAADPNIRSASITNQAGYVLLATDALMNADWSPRIFVREALKGHLYASPAAREGGEVSQYYSAPLINNAGDVAGALVIRVAVQEMWDVLTTQPNVWILDENSVRIADSSDRPQLFTALTPLSGDTLTDVMDGMQYGEEVEQIRSMNLGDLARAVQRREKAAVYRDTSGQLVHAAIRPLKNKPWTVVAFESEDRLFAPALWALADQVKIVALAALFAAALTFAYLRQSSTAERQA